MLTAPTLTGRAVVLEPLRADHVDGLVAAAGEDRASFGYSEIPDGPQATTAYVALNVELAAQGRQIPFAVRLLADGRIVGSTRFMDLEVFVSPPPLPLGVVPPPAPSDEQPPSVVEIGGTWYAASVQRTIVNTECKLLMLRYAFDVWSVLRVTLKTDSRNARSRTAIERIGATFEGIRRVHTPAVDGGIRDSAYYSITTPEWPAVHAHLIELIEQGP